MIHTSLLWIAQNIESSKELSDDERKLFESIAINGVSTDTRTLKKGDLFIALQGDNFDGHEYLNVAKQKGASAAIISRLTNCALPSIVVTDTKLALGQLAKAVKQKVAPRTIGITGSSGKTTVKEMVRSILSQRGNVLATKGNFNNDIGVPLTLLNLKEEHDFAVVEMGANHQGEIEYTCDLVQPDVSTIVNAAPAHIEGFGSLFGVARAKSEIIKGLAPNALAILNRDSQFFEFWEGTSNTQRIETFSYQSEKGDYHARNVSISKQGCAEFELVSPAGTVAIKLRVPGVHNVGNAVLAAALSMSVGADLSDVKNGLFEMNGVSGRLAVKVLSDNIKVIDDSYNANVGSVKAALDLLSNYQGHKIFVFGDMGELGDQAQMYHRQIGEYALSKQIDYVVNCGGLSRYTSEVFDEYGFHSDNTQQCAQLVIDKINDLKTSDIEQENSSIPISVLVKGSRSAHMERVVEIVSSHFIQASNNNKKEPQ